ncbi:hypothetical protein BT69DRAFT_1264400, partial [Atractiella rhizophila]
MASTNPLTKQYTLQNPTHDANQKSPYFQSSTNPAKRVRATVGNGGAGSHDQQGPKYFEVLYRIPQSRKHKTWDGDGILLLMGKKAQLRNEDGANIDKGEVIGRADKVGDLFRVGAYEVEISDSASASQFYRSIPPPASSSHRPEPRNTSYIAPHIITGGSRTVTAPALHPSPMALPMPRAQKSHVLLPKRANSPSKDAPPPCSILPPITVDLDEEIGGGKILSDEGSPVGRSKSNEKEKGRGGGLHVAQRQGAAKEFQPVIGVKRKAEVLEERGKEGEWKYFNVQYRKPQHKKHKTWDADGILIVDLRGDATLYKSEKKVKIGSGNLSNHLLREDKELFLSGFELKIISSLRPSSFISGDIYLSYHELTLTNNSTRSALDAPIASTFFGGGEPAVATTNGNSFRDPMPGGSTASRHAGVTKNSAKPRHDPLREGAVVMRRPDARFAANESRNPKGLEVTDVVIDPMIGNKLMDHQKEGVRFLYECVSGLREEGYEGCILADDMGLGKTVQAITLIWTLLRQSMFFGGGPMLKRALIVCPKTLTRNWEKEFRKWLGRDRVRLLVANKKEALDSLVLSSVYQVVIISYDMLRMNIDKLQKCRPKIGLMICDEGHKLKSAEAQITVALKKLDCPRRIILTGTPIQNNLLELHSLMGFVNPNLLGQYAEFKKHFEIPITRADNDNCSAANRELAQDRKEQLKELIDPFM